MSIFNLADSGIAQAAAVNIAADLAAIAGSTAITLAADLQFRSGDLGLNLPVFWHQDDFYLLVSGDAIRAGIRTSDGSFLRLYAQDASFADLAAHRVELSMDSAAGTFRVSVDGRAVFARAALDFTLPATFAATEIGTAAGRPTALANISNVSVSAPLPPAETAGLLSRDGVVTLTFDSGSPPAGLVLKGGAAIGTDGVLTLDGKGGYAELTERHSLEDADYLSVELDFRFSDLSDTGNARLIWNHGAFGIRVHHDGVNLMVANDKGQQEFFWRGGLDILDADWHHVSLTIDPVNSALTFAIDGETLIHSTSQSLSLPDTGRATTIGSDGWGSDLNGQIDNVVLSTKRPLESTLDPAVPEAPDAEGWDAVGLANPAVALNTTGYIKWEASTAATFIDRMKGAHAWSGKQEILYSDQGSYHVFRDINVFNNPAAAESVTFSGATLLNLDLLLSIARWNAGRIDKAQHDAILANPGNFFQIVTGASGRSELHGRLYETDAFALLARFDTDIGMDFATLRDQGHVWLRQSDIAVRFGELDMDENGWVKSLPVNIAGGSGSVSSVVMWYPEEAGQAPGSIYSGTFNLLAEGQGTIDLLQSGGSADRVNMRGVEIDGPTIIPFDYTPDGQRLTLSITSTDPDGTGEYVRNLSIVHESHLEMFQAGEIFTPEFTELHADSRAVRWMAAQEGHRIVPGAEGAFEDFHTGSYYTFNQGTNGTPLNGIPVDVIIEFANKTGTDPWISVPVNASDAFVRGMAEYIEANLDPRLSLHVEFANENWNGVFPSYQEAKKAGLERWGELKLETDAGGAFVRDAEGNLIVKQDGFFFSRSEAAANGFRSLDALAAELKLGHGVYADTEAWAEWTAFRATQVALIFDDVFTAADPDNADARLTKVMGAQTSWARATDMLLEGNAWREAEPDSWTDPATVFDALAVAGYFGDNAGNRHSDMVRYWINQYGEDKAAELLVRQLKKDADPSLRLIEIEAGDIAAGNLVKPSAVHDAVPYGPDLVIDVFGALFAKNLTVRNDILNGKGMSGTEILVGADVHHYVRLDSDGAGNTVLQLRIDPAKNDFQTIVTFDGQLSVTIEEMLEAGTLFVRSLPSIGETAALSFDAQKAKADAYDLDLLAYEGGQHLAAGNWGPFRGNLADAVLTDFLIAVNQSPEMGALYEYWLDAWQDAGGELFAHYADVGLPSRYGTWGVLEHLGEQNEPGAETFRLDALEAVNQQEAWWDDGRDPSAFLHGVSIIGTDADETLRGTAEEDILLGGGGDDLIQGGPGGDTLGGGEGANVIEAGSGDDMILLASAADRIDGGEGFDTLRIAASMAFLDLGALNAVSIEAVDARNYAKTTLAVSTADVFAFSADRTLTLCVETADTLELAGFAYQGPVPADDGIAHLYQGLAGVEAVSLTVITDTGHLPDILLAA